MQTKAPRGGGGASGTESIASPSLIVVLVLLMGATVYLWRQRYIRRKTAYIMLAVLGAALVTVGVATYQARF